jgi:hypothetical protein
MIHLEILAGPMRFLLSARHGQALQSLQGAKPGDRDEFVFLLAFQPRKLRGEIVT